MCVCVYLGVLGRQYCHGILSSCQTYQQTESQIPRPLTFHGFLNESFHWSTSRSFLETNININILCDHHRIPTWHEISVRAKYCYASLKT